MFPQSAVNLPTGDTPPRLIPIAEVCVMVRCGRDTLLTASSAGHLRVIRRGRRSFIPDSDLSQWINSGMPVREADAL